MNIHIDMMDYNKLPKVSFIMVQSRQNKWVDIAKSSINIQYYPNKEFIVIDNLKKDKSIGKCYNEGAKKATGMFCLFVGDDDKLAPDYTMSLVLNILYNIINGKKQYGITSHVTAFDDEMEFSTPVLLYPTGMWNREYLLDNPFDEKLKKKIDTEYYNNGGMDVATIVGWNYGYFYRQHDDQVSGRNLSKNKIKELKKEQKSRQNSLKRKRSKDERH